MIRIALKHQIDVAAAINFFVLACTPGQMVVQNSTKQQPCRPLNFFFRWALQRCWHFTLASASSYAISGFETSNRCRGAEYFSTLSYVRRASDYCSLLCTFFFEVCFSELASSRGEGSMLQSGLRRGRRTLRNRGCIPSYSVFFLAGRHALGFVRTCAGKVSIILRGSERGNHGLFSVKRVA